MALKDDIYYYNYLPWTEGTGSATGFNQNGSTDENSRVYFTNPWGQREVLWRGQHNGIGNDGDGGWYQSTSAIDSTKMYRFSVFFNRYAIDTSGRNYFGVYGYGSTNGVYPLNSETANTNFYWWFTNSPPTTISANTWYVFIGHIWPHTTGVTSVLHPDAGIWNLDGTKQTSISNECRWIDVTTTCITRTYLFYCNTYTNNITYWARPRLDLCDGTQPTKEALLRDGRAFTFGNVLVN